MPPADALSARNAYAPLPMRLLAALAGATLGSLAHTLLFPGSPGLAWVAPRFALLLIGNLPLAVAAALLVVVVPGRLRSAAGSRAEAWWLGVAVALAPLPGSWAAASTAEGSSAGRLMTLVVAVLLGVLALRLAHRGAPARRVSGSLAVASVLVVAVHGWVALAQAEIDADDRATLPAASGSMSAPEGAPDLLFISLDTLRADATLDPRVPTPTFDALRERALWAPYALTPVPTTVPSHLTMFTGAHPFLHGVRSNYGRLPDNFRTLAGELQDRGWRTLGLATLAAMRPDAGVARGFEVYDNLALPQDAARKVVDLLTRVMPRGSWLGLLLPAPLDRNLIWHAMRRGLPAVATQGWVDGADARHVATAYLRDLQAQPDPYFCFLHFSDPHTPYIPAPGFAGLLADQERTDRLLPDGVEKTDEKLFRFITDLRGGTQEAQELVELLHDLYLEEVALTDDILGEVLRVVEDGGRDTLVVIVGDHGEQFGEHGLMGHGNSLFAPLMRVPFLLLGEGVPAGEVAGGSVHMRDIAPTLFGLLGLERLEQMEGRDLLAPDTVPARHFMATTWEVALRDGDWKLLAEYTALGLPEMTLEPRALYNLAQDPGEERNLLKTEPEQAAAMFQTLARAASVAEPGLRSDLSAGDRLRLDALGYVDDGD